MKTVKAKSYNWRNGLSERGKTGYIVIHHAAASEASPDVVHGWHLGKGWAGIGYHVYVCKDGTAYEGRPINTVGAHATGYNSVSVGVCFEGDFEKETISQAQKLKGIEVVNELRTMYPGAKIVRHKDLMATSCPGKNFPFEEIASGILPKKLETVNDIVWELNHRGIMMDKPLWLKKCVLGSNAYWLAFKIANLTKNSTERKNKLETVNDLVWELNHRGIITDKALWLKLLKDDKELYWLAYKAVNMTVNK